jgi:RNA polymerase sigma-70 factor (ECF subfamily)
LFLVLSQLSALPQQGHISEEELVARLQRNDRVAYEYLYDNYSAALYGVIHRIVLNEETASDVLQDAFVKIWNGISSYDPKKGKLFTWMLNISRNMAIDKTRSKDFNNNQKNQSTEIVVNQMGRLKTDDLKPEHIGLAELIEKLDPNEKFLIDLMYFKGYTQSEIAEEYNIPLGTVKTRLRSATMNLRKIFIS